MPLMPAVELVSTIAPPCPRSIIDGMAISTVLNTPVRLTSITSCQASWVSCTAIGAMPALASTMSTGPSWATPASNAARRPASSRTSAWLATIRRSSASTSLTVSARSSGVAIGYGTVSIWAHRSTAMMLAPSCASRMAWLRPWPRAAPVMKATLPSSFRVIPCPSCLAAASAMSLRSPCCLCWPGRGRGRAPGRAAAIRRAGHVLLSGRAAPRGLKLAPGPEGLGGPAALPDRLVHRARGDAVARPDGAGPQLVKLLLGQPVPAVDHHGAVDAPLLAGPDVFQQRRATARRAQPRAALARDAGSLQADIGVGQVARQRQQRPDDRVRGDNGDRPAGGGQPLGDRHADRSAA